jgi:NDP-sugar pyrophosphorylase family protein
MPQDDHKVIIPIGGEATRLRPLTVEISKAVVRLLNRPLIEFTILELAKQGFKEIIFGARGYWNYRDLLNYFGEGYGFSARYGIKPRVHFKYMPRYESVGNADAVRVSAEYYDINEDFVVVQGDNIFRTDVRKALELHKQKGAFMTIVLKRVENVEEFGVAVVNEEGRILKFVEKPKKEEAPSNLANTGMYVISPEIRKVFKSHDLQEMLKMGRMDFGKDVIPYLIAKGYPVYAYEMEGLWFDVGTPQRYLEAMRTLLTTLDEKDLRAFRVTKDSRIFVQGTSPDSVKRRKRITRMYNQGKLKLEGSVLIGRHCQIGEGTTIEDSNVDNFTIVGKNVRIVRSAIMDMTIIGDYAVIENSIIGRYVEIRSTKNRPTKIINSVIADDVVIEPGTELVNSRIYPHKHINAESKLFDTVLT